MKPGYRNIKSRLLVFMLIMSSMTALHPQAAKLSEIGIAGVYVEKGLDEKNLRQTVADALDTMIRRYGVAHAIAIGDASSPYKITVSATANPFSVVVIMAGPEENRDSTWLGSTNMEDLALFLPPILFSQFATCSGLTRSSGEMEPPATFELSLKDTEDIFRFDATQPVVLASAAAIPGKICISAMNSAAWFDEFLSIKSVENIDPRQPYLYAYAMAASPSGTVSVIGTAGDWYRKTKGSLVFERAGSVPPSLFNIAGSPEGSLIYQDSISSKFYRQDGRRKTELVFKSATATSMMPFTIDADGNIWVYDMITRLVKAYEPGGRLIDVMRLSLDDPVSGVPLRILVPAGGGVIAINSSGVRAYDREGLPTWSIKQAQSAIDPARAGMVQNAMLSSSGDALYVIVSGDWRVTRYELKSLKPDSVGFKLSSFNKAIALSIENRRAHLDRIALLDSVQNREMAYSCRLLFNELFPGDRATEQALVAYGRSIQALKIQRIVQRTQDTLRTLGIESARIDYLNALKSMELYLSAFPDDLDMVRMKETLVENFRERENPKPAIPPPLRIVTVKFNDVFPAFMERYRFVPIGTVSVKNESSAPVPSVLIQISIRDFTDFPAETAYDQTIAPGATVEIPVFLLLNKSTLEIQEDITVQVSVDAIAGISGARTAQSFVPLLIRRRTALTWADSAAIASFITPNEDTISSFARDAVLRRTAEPNIPFNRVFSRAVAIVDALAALSPAYVEDPSSPFSSVEGKPTAVDTVRFPRVTLAARVGDCDDTSALLASALEAAGVRTAIVTTPGHILVAFSTDENEGAAKRFSYADYGAIPFSGESWIPVETTILAKGFSEAWKNGYQAVLAAGPAVEIIPLAKARLAYPALPLPASPSSVPMPSATDIREIAQKSQKRMIIEILEPVLVNARALIAKRSSTADASKTINQAGILCACFGRYDDAISLLQGGITLNPASAGLRQNLYNALRMAGRTSEADKVLAEARLAIPANPSLERLALADQGGTTRASLPPSDPAEAAASAEASAEASAGNRGDAAEAFEADWSF